MMSNTRLSVVICFIAAFFAALALSLPFAPILRAQEYESLKNPIVAPSDSGAYHAINQLPLTIRSSAPFAREFYEFARHAGSSGVVDNDAYLTDFEQARQDMLRASDSRANAGTGAGKNSALALEGTWSNIGLTGGDSIPTAGITTAIVFDPQHPNIMYAGGEGGVWKSSDTGSNWFELTDMEFPNLSVATIAVDPVNTDTLYAGTGYCYNSEPVYNGSGLYQSTNGGTSFNRLNVPGGAEAIVKVVVDPSNHTNVLAAVYGTSTNPLQTGPVYRSTNAGATWTSVFSGFAWDIIAIPQSPGVFYLFSDGVYKSTNDGVGWTKVSTSNFPSSLGRGALASPTQAPNKIFTLMTDPYGADAYLYESTNAGTSWVSITSIPPDLFAPSVGGKTNPQGWYDLYVGVTPYSVQSDTVYIAGIDAAYIYGTDAQIQQGSVGWTAFSGYPNGSGGGGTTHVDHHSFAVNPINSNIVYDGDDGGLWVNYAAGSTNVSSGGGWKLHSHGMVTSRLYHLAFDHNNLSRTWAGAQDQGLWKIDEGTPQLPPASFAPLGDAMQPLVNPQNSSRVYGEGSEGEIVVTSSLVTPNWESIADSAEGVTDAPGWDNPFKMSPVANGSISGASILYVGRQHLWQSSDGGTDWKQLSPKFGSADAGLYYCTAIGLPSWNANMIYAAGGTNSFQLSTNFGTSWVAKTNPGYVTSINTSWHNPKFVVVTLSENNKKVMFSVDSGHTWTERSGKAGAALPGADSNSACNIMSLALDSTNPLSTWYAATDFGVYQTNDTGLHWSWMGPGLFPCRDIQIFSNGSTMRVATYGRGMWEVQLPIVFSGVESTVLSATKSSAGTELSWSVEGEPQGATFYVERSLDGDAFARMGAVAGNGPSAGTLDYSFADNTTAPGTYLYRIHEIDANGAEQYSNQVELHYGTNGLYLYQPYPNPFILNSGSANAVTLNFEIPAMDHVQLRIYDVKGTLVRTLLNRTMDGGPQSTVWDARDDQGNPVAPGAYFYSIQTANSGTASGKIMVVRE